MQLSNLQPAKGSVKTGKRIGRGQGSGRGARYGRGPEVLRHAPPLHRRLLDPALRRRHQARYDLRRHRRLQLQRRREPRPRPRSSRHGLTLARHRSLALHPPLPRS